MILHNHDESSHKTSWVAIILTHGIAAGDNHFVPLVGAHGAVYAEPTGGLHEYDVAICNFVDGRWPPPKSSSSTMFGIMLVSLTRNRTAKPSPNTSAHRAADCREFLLS
jgi:hypothetical protein